MAVLSSMRVRFEDVRELAFGSITTSYAAVGSAFSQPLRMLKIVNATNTPMYISYDGVNDKDWIAANSQFIYDYGTNKADQASVLEQTSGERVYVKYDDDFGAPTSGKVVVITIYASSV